MNLSKLFLLALLAVPASVHAIIINEAVQKNEAEESSIIDITAEDKILTEAIKCVAKSLDIKIFYIAQALEAGVHVNAENVQAHWDKAQSGLIRCENQRIAALRNLQAENSK